MFLAYKTPFAFIFERVVLKDYPTSYVIQFQIHDLNTKNKFEVFNRFNNSELYSTYDKNIFNTVFYKSQMIHRHYRNLYQKYKIKKAVKYDCLTTLQLEPLYLLKNEKVLDILHENTIYKFAIFDILKIIRNSLLEHDNFFNNPKFPKNPYNNIPFTKENLYYIYSYMKTINYRVPALFERFIVSNCNIKRFHRDNELFIRHNSICDYPNQLSIDTLYEEIVLFLRGFMLNTIYLHIGFPKKEVVDKCIHLLRLFWHSQYEFTNMQRTYYRGKLYIQMDNFIKNIGNFGRIIIKRGENCTSEYKDYIIKNLLSREIPEHLNTLNKIHLFMKAGIITPRTPTNIYVVEDDEQTQDEMESDDEINVIMRDMNMDFNDDDDDDEEEPSVELDNESDYDSY